MTKDKVELGTGSIRRYSRLWDSINPFRPRHSIENRTGIDMVCLFQKSHGPVRDTGERGHGVFLRPILAFDFGNLRALDADTGHQALLTEDEGIGIILKRRG